MSYLSAASRFVLLVMCAAALSSCDLLSGRSQEVTVRWYEGDAIETHIAWTASFRADTVELVSEPAAKGSRFHLTLIDNGPGELPEYVDYASIPKGGGTTRPFTGVIEIATWQPDSLMSGCIGHQLIPGQERGAWSFGRPCMMARRSC